MSNFWQRDRDNPLTVEEILNHEQSDRLVKSHVAKVECPHCGHVQIATYRDGWNNPVTCQECHQTETLLG